MTVKNPLQPPALTLDAQPQPLIYLLETETQALIDWADQVTQTNETIFHQAQQIAGRLGAHYRADGLTEFGFWTPELAADVIQSERTLELEFFTPIETIDFRALEQTVLFRRDRIPVMPHGEYLWAVVAGITPGRRDQAGSFYWLRYIDGEGRRHRLRDPLAYSLPYGVFAPAEVYDMDQLQQERQDLDYFRRMAAAEQGLEEDAIPRMAAPTNILQIHVKTASADGTIEGLSQIFETISTKLAAGEALTSAETAYTGYDAIQLLPIEPTIEYRREDTNIEHGFFALPEDHGPEDHGLDTRVPVIEATVDDDLAPLKVILREPNTQNWGYDVPILGSAATNPAVLGSLRPDEVVDLSTTLHNFSQGPIALIYDIVYGHADNQALDLLTQQFFKGTNMYGLDLNHQLPQVRAILLEMQRRKINTGADGIRIDGGQDFRFFNPLSGRVEYDDMYLLAMSDLVQDIGGHQRRLFTIFEDGRPWPEEGWEETSTYRELIEAQPGSFQWGPLIFAHNTPTIKGFWDRKWSRVCEVIAQGDHWITGCGNHDTVRRGNQVDPEADINWNLGQTLPSALGRAYNNAATLIWVHGFSPGLPMDFLNAGLETPWGFFRNTDDRYGVKVVSEEVGFLDWEIEPEQYLQPYAFPQLKKLGFETLEQLKEFAKALREAMIETDYDLQEVAKICQHCLGDNADGVACEVPALEDLNGSSLPRFLATLDVPKLKYFAMAFMEDGHDMCNVAHYFDSCSPNMSAFSYRLREFRRQRPWLRENLTGVDRFNRISDDDRTIFYGYRVEPHPPDHRPAQEVVMLAHMGGEPMTATPGDWLQLELDDWDIAVASPGLEPQRDLIDLRSFDLKDGEGLLLMPRK